MIKHSPFDCFHMVHARCLASADFCVEDRFDVDDRRSIQRFKIAHPQSHAFNRSDFYRVQADRIRTVRGACAEDALQRSRGIPPRMHA